MIHCYPQPKYFFLLNLLLSHNLNELSIVQLGIKHFDVYLCVYDAIKKIVHQSNWTFPSLFNMGLQVCHWLAVKLDGNYIDAECLKP